MVSNYLLWQENRLLSARAQGEAFALFEGRTVQPGQTLAWRDATEKVDTGPVRLQDGYRCGWRPYSTVGDHKVEFRYLVLKPGRDVTTAHS